MKEFEEFVEQNCLKSGEIVPARLQAAMALLERLRDHPSLHFSDHHKEGSSGFIGQETYGNRVHEQLGLQPINANHGRRSSNLAQWGPILLEVLAKLEFQKLTKEEQSELISKAQAVLEKPLRHRIEKEPLEAKVRSGTAVSVVKDLLRQADKKGKSGDVAQYLVGAKLALRFNRDIAVLGANKGDRKSLFDEDARMGDFEIENAIIEVAVGPPDEKHLNQIRDILEKSDAEVWLLTRDDRVPAWKNEVDQLSIDHRRVIVSSVETFVGQNVSEIAEFSLSEKEKTLEALIRLYNEKWINQVGSPDIKIVVK